MKKNLLALTLTSLMSLSAFATHDSYVRVQIPVSGMNESGVCLIDSGAARKTLEEGQQAIYAGVMNAVNNGGKLVKVVLVGLPDQKGINAQVPTSFKSNFSKTSPYLAALKKELVIADGIKNCR